jgi:hypothetical protein
MTAYDPAGSVLVAADIADAIDPDLDKDTNLEAALKAIKRDPEIAILLATSITKGLIEGLGTQHPDGTAGVMLQIRRNMTLLPPA